MSRPSPERVGVNAMVQNRIQMMIRDSQYQEKPEVRAALTALFNWLQISLMQSLKKMSRSRSPSLPLCGLLRPTKELTIMSEDREPIDGLYATGDLSSVS